MGQTKDDIWMKYDLQQSFVPTSSKIQQAGNGPSRRLAQGSKK